MVMGQGRNRSCARLDGAWRRARAIRRFHAPLAYRNDRRGIAFGRYASGESANLFKETDQNSDVFE